MSVERVYVLRLHRARDAYELGLCGKVECGQGIKGVSVHVLSAADLRVIADEITAQLDAIEKQEKQ